MKIALIGYGKMGHEIERILMARGHEIPLIIDYDTTDRMTAENLAACDVAIDARDGVRKYRRLFGGGCSGSVRDDGVAGSAAGGDGFVRTE